MIQWKLSILVCAKYFFLELFSKNEFLNLPFYKYYTKNWNYSIFFIQNSFSYLFQISELSDWQLMQNFKWQLVHLNLVYRRCLHEILIKVSCSWKYKTSWQKETCVQCVARCVHDQIIWKTTWNIAIIRHLN